MLIADTAIAMMVEGLGFSNADSSHKSEQSSRKSPLRVSSIAVVPTRLHINRCSATEINLQLTSRVLKVQMAQRKLSGISPLIDYIRSPPVLEKICLCPL